MLLRPVHRWFFLWEDVVPSAYRIVAVAIGAAISSVIVVLTARVRWLVAFPLATVGWITLAIVQEHDERVHLEVDSEFRELLREQADPTFERSGFTFNGAFGPCRARSDRSDTFLYEATDPSGNDCIDVWIRRDRSGGQMETLVDGHLLEELVAAHGHPLLATRVTRAEEPAGDATALTAALELVLGDFRDGPTRLPDGRVRQRCSEQDSEGAQEAP